MLSQLFRLMVPASNCSMTAGNGGPVNGFAVTTGGDCYFEADQKIALEAVGDMYLQSTGSMAEVATGGITLGSPNTIAGQAGGDVKLFAGAGMSPNLGGKGAMGAPPEPPGPAKVNAGAKAESRNKIGDTVKAAGDIAGGAYDLAKGSGWERVKGGWDVLKNGWEITKTHSSTVGESTAAKYVDMGVAAVDGVMGVATGDGGAEKVMEGALGAVATGLALDEATAAKAGSSTDGSAGSGPGGQGGGGKIIEVAPSNIERTCGANMTSKVAGDHKNSVDGSVEYLAGSKITLKAFSKVETSSTLFEAHAHARAVMKGLAMAKVESLGFAVLDGKARFKVNCGGLGKINAGTLKVDAKGMMDATAGGKLTMKAALVWIDGPTHITEDVHIKGEVEIVKNLLIKNQLEVDAGIKSKANVFAEADVKCKGVVHARNGAKLGA